MYEYKAEVLSIYDGDTMNVLIDLGLNIKVKKQLRLYGIDTPELRGIEKEYGILARDYVRRMIPIGSKILVATQRDSTGKYGRLLADVWFTDDVLGEVHLNSDLIDKGYAAEYGK
jgi:micrococcal nuclease